MPFSAESSVFANELKKDKFCVVSLEPGWVDTDMGGGNARKLGMEKAPTDVHHSISTMLKTIQQLSFKDSGEFLTIDGNKMDY
jgi:NAD(P)-dependent dehydrogenase (short-subunit alcohol dehydrogenase family)